VVGISGLRQGQGSRLSARIVDDAVAGTACARERVGRRARISRQTGAGNGVQVLGQEEIKPHKVRYYLERRDAEFEQKMAEVLCVYREVQVLKKAAKSQKPRQPVAIVSYDEKPGIQAIATTAPDLPPEPGVHATFARDHEYKRHGTLSLLAGIDLLTGKVHALVRDRHRSREFIEFSGSLMPPIRPAPRLS
jgi:hypothetical protein